MRCSKYGNVKTIVDDIKFDSKKEAARYSELKLLEIGGVITDLQLQPKFTLIESYTNAAGKKIRATHYIADFMYRDRSLTVVEDVKGMKTAVYRLKKKMFEYKYPHMTITEI